MEHHKERAWSLLERILHVRYALSLHFFKQNSLPFWNQENIDPRALTLWPASWVCASVYFQLTGAHGTEHKAQMCFSGCDLLCRHFSITITLTTTTATKQATESWHFTVVLSSLLPTTTTKTLISFYLMFLRVNFLQQFNAHSIFKLPCRPFHLIQKIIVIFKF